MKNMEKIRVFKYNLEKLTFFNKKEILDLENKSMQTETTFPLTEKELDDIFKSGYEVFGYKNKDKILISKVGFTREDDGWELDICTDPEYQGKGIGKNILVDSLNEFYGDNIHLKVHPDNPAFRLYEKVGFVKVGEIDTDNGPRIIMLYKQ